LNLFYGSLAYFEIWVLPAEHPFDDYGLSAFLDYLPTCFMDSQPLAIDFSFTDGVDFSENIKKSENDYLRRFTLEGYHDVIKQNAKNNRDAR